MATLVIEALQSALPLRRCTRRLGVKHVATADATPCSAAQIGASQCPCAGVADRAAYDIAVDHAVRALEGDPVVIRTHLTARMATLAAAQRFEEAALVRDRLAALLRAVQRERLTRALREAGRCTVRRGDTTWVVDGGRLIDTTISGEVGRALPVDPPDEVPADRPLRRHHVDEALCLAKYFERHAGRLEVVACSGRWAFPTGATDELPTLPRTGQDETESPSVTSSTPVTVAPA